VQLVSKIANVCDHKFTIHQRYRRTDNTRSQDRALHYSASRGNKSQVENLRQTAIDLTNYDNLRTNLGKFCKFGPRKIRWRKYHSHLVDSAAASRMMWRRRGTDANLMLTKNTTLAARSSPALWEAYSTSSQAGEYICLVALSSR